MNEWKGRRGGSSQVSGVSTCLATDAVCCDGECWERGGHIKDDDLPDKEQVWGESRHKMVQFGASELTKIATFLGRCPIGT